jgi:wyosine [tRNA(Phe)-imidazoG37] synthetase (radical SAM superfamily)
MKRISRQTREGRKGLFFLGVLGLPWRENRFFKSGSAGSLSAAQILRILGQSPPRRRRLPLLGWGMLPEAANRPPSPPACQPLPARNFFGNRFVYCVISQRAGGLSIGVNMNPDKRCNFDCVYCEVDRTRPGGPTRLPVAEMLLELEKLLTVVYEGRPEQLGSAAAGLLSFKEVALSGDGEPTLSPNFREITESVAGLRARRVFPPFKIVLITNGTGLHLPQVRVGLEVLNPGDEIWVKLDVGTQAGLEKINRASLPLESLLGNIRELGRLRPIVIQSLFPLVGGVEPAPEEIEAYTDCLCELKEAGAQISLVQVYSAHRPAMDSACGHLPLRSLSRIARTVRERTGLNAEVF